MLRIVAVTAALTALAGGTLAARAADTPDSVLPLAKLASCDMSSPAPTAAFYGKMAAIPGAARLLMRFTLMERLGRADDWSKLDVPALRQWRRSLAGVKTFGYKQTVGNLHEGGAYKARIQYRWLTPAGAILDTVSRDTPVCRGPLPNFAVVDLEVRAGPTSDTRTYRVGVTNNGKADADQVEVVLTVDRAVLDTVMIDHLSAGDSRTVSFTGPACNHAVRVKVDPSNTIGELFEDDNNRQFSCSG